jgi:hypothetical protein
VQSIVVLLDEVVGLVADRAREMADEEPVLVPDLPVLLQLGLPGQVQPAPDYTEQERNKCPNELRPKLRPRNSQKRKT